MNDYSTKCPICGEGIYLVSALVECRALVQQDGWDVFDSPYFNTEDEHFNCSTGCGPVPSKYVFGNEDREHAASTMRGKKWST